MLNRITRVALCALLAVPIVGCAKRIERQDKDVDKAADHAMRESKDLREDLPRAVVSGNVSAIDKDIADVDRTQSDFAIKKDVRVAALRGVHALQLNQLTMMRGVEQALTLTTAGQQDVDDKFTDVSQALDASGKLIEALPAATAGEWASKDDEVSAAMNRLMVAMQDAQVALRDAPRTVITPAS